MIDSTLWSVREFREGACGLADVVVEPDAGGEGEEFGGDPGSEAVKGAGVVAFEPEPVFQGPEDAFDALADRSEVRPFAGLVFAVRSEDPRAVTLGGQGRALAAGVALVGNDRLAAVQTDREQPERDLAFFLIGRGEDRGAGCPVRCGQQMQSHPPEPSGVASRIPIAAGVSELRTTGGLDRAAALHRGGVDQHDAVSVSWAVAGEHADQPLDQVATTLPAFPIPGLFWQPREQVPQLLGGDREKLGVVVDAHHLLRHRERDDLRVGHSSPRVSALLGQEVIRGNENRSEEQIEVGVHLGPSFGSAGWHYLSTADFDCSSSDSYSTTAEVVESII